jgi:hypothetical protein
LAWTDCTKRAIQAALLAATVFSFSHAASAQSAAPFNRYLASAEAGKVDTRLDTFARACVSGDAKPARKFFYTEQSNWLPVKDLHFAFAGYVTGVANSAEVWEFAGVPRVVYQWEVDLEYQRDTLFCLNKSGDVTKAVSRFFSSQAGDSEENWVYVRTTRRGQHENTWQTVGVYQDQNGKRIADPDLSSEDKDFIKGERVVHYWNDFDFAELMDHPAVQKKDKQ